MESVDTTWTWYACGTGVEADKPDRRNNVYSVRPVESQSVLPVAPLYRLGPEAHRPL